MSSSHKHVRGERLAVCEVLNRVEDSALALNGEPIDEPIASFSFIMNTREEIQQTMRDYESGWTRRLAPPAGIGGDLQVGQNK
jgi:redox-sensitive bicupin YhaK (pirin superfamily)